MTKVISVLLLLSFFIFFVVVSAVFYLDKSSMLETVSHAQIKAHSYELQKEFESYINLPIMANSAIANALDQHEEDDIPSQDVVHVLRHVINETFKNEADLKNLQYGSVSNDFAGIDHDPRFPEREFLTLSNDDTNNLLTSFETLSEKSKVMMRLPRYNMKERPWFKDAYETKQASWSPVFMDLDKFKQLGVSYNSPAFNKKGKLIGVISSELYLPDLNKKLIKLKPYKQSTLIITDAYNRIFASSDPKLTTIQGSDTSYLLSMKAAPVKIRRIADKLSAAGSSQVIKVNIDGEDFYTSRFPVADAENKMKMQVMIIVPVQTVLSTIKQHNVLLITSLLALFALTLFIMHNVLSLLTSPLQKMVSRMANFEHIDWDELPNKWHFKEIDDLETGFRKLALKLKSTLKNLNEKIELDPVTGLYTQGGLVKNEKLYQKRNVMALIHLSNTKSIINTLGENYTNEMLCKIISKIKKEMPSDTLMARLKQDKLLIVFPGKYSADAVKKCSDLILKILASSKSGNSDQDHPFYGVAGMVVEDITHDNAEILMKNAWIALNAIDSKNRGVVSLYSEDMRKKEYRNIRIYDHLRNAITKGELYLVLQPIVEKQNDISCKAGECLLRWRNDELGNISPAEFIPVAEESGLIVSLGEWVIEESCRELAEFIKRGGPEDFTLHINVSPLQLITKGFAFHLLEQIALHGLHTSNICIEITEGVMVSDTASVIAILNYLRRHGIMVSLDDFGTGFSGLSYLHTLPFDSIKIDAAFFKEGINDKNLPLITAMIALAKGYNVTLIAEGIESEDIYKTLSSMGCIVYQGYYFARPDVFSSWQCEGNTLLLNSNVCP